MATISKPCTLCKPRLLSKQQEIRSLCNFFVIRIETKYTKFKLFFKPVLNKFSSFGELNCQRIDYIQCCCAYSAHAQSTRQLLGSLNQKWLLALIEVTCCAPFGKEKAVRLQRHLTICSLTKDLVCTVKLGDKEWFDKEQIGVKEPFAVTNFQLTS